MKITRPPSSKPGQNFEKFILRFIDDFETEFSEGNFDNRYFPSFKWFEKSVGKIDNVINFGCSHGRETFALAWRFGVIEAMGIDKNSKRIKVANDYVRLISNFNEQFPNYLRKLPLEYAEKIRKWYEEKFELKEAILPIFRQRDLINGLDSDSNSFDLAYSRYVVDKIEEKARLGVIEEMGRIVKSGGNLIIVGPDKILPDDFAIPGFHIINKVDKDSLGLQEDSDTNPKGFLLIKQ